MHGLLDTLEPTLGPQEEGYRLHFFRADKARATGSVLIALAFLVVVFVFELNFLDRAQIAPVATIRVLFFALSLGIIAVARGMERPEELDRVAFIWTVAFAAQFVALSVYRPASRIDDVAIVLIALAIYALEPAPLGKRMVPSFILVLGYLLVLWLVRGESPSLLWPTAIVLVATNALGIWASSRLHAQRRRQYQSQESLRLSLQERDALIDRLRQSHKMESMGRIVGGVAHDFNNILGTMLASVDFLIEELPAGGTPRADAETIRASVQRGAELTHQLLAFSRQQVLEPKVVSLNDLVSDTQRMLMRTLGADIAIRVSLGDRLAAVRVDPGQVQQILLNLSVNARDAMPSGGALSIQTRNVPLSEATQMAHSVAKPGQYVVLTVSDDGTGMNAATLAQIFEPFFTTKPKGRGTGLGLSTVFGIVEQSGGHIRVASAPGKGTTFHVFLPAVAESPHEITAPREVALPRGSETILLAEDDAELRTLTARVLTAQGYRVLEASDGVDALRVAEEHHGALDLLTTDMVMPIMGGHDLAKELTAKRPGLKVLFVSGYSDDAVGRGAVGPGDAFLQKPVDPKTLARKVRQVLDGGVVG